MKGDRGRRVQKRGPRGEVSMCLRARGHRKEEGTGGRKRKVWKGEGAGEARSEAAAVALLRVAPALEARACVDARREEERKGRRS